jgi:hypothetical protein
MASGDGVCKTCGCLFRSKRSHWSLGLLSPKFLFLFSSLLPRYWEPAGKVCSGLISTCAPYSRPGRRSVSNPGRRCLPDSGVAWGGHWSDLICYRFMVLCLFRLSAAVLQICFNMPPPPGTFFFPLFGLPIALDRYRRRLWDLQAADRSCGDSTSRDSGHCCKSSSRAHYPN